MMLRYTFNQTRRPTAIEAAVQTGARPGLAHRRYLRSRARSKVGTRRNGRRGGRGAGMTAMSNDCKRGEMISEWDWSAGAAWSARC